MPLYMNIQAISDFTIDRIRNASQAVEDQYGIKYHQCWVNKAAGRIFCLMEGPDKASCEMVHREAYGSSDCEIIEVEPSMYHLAMEENYLKNHILSLHENRTINIGYRFVLVIDFSYNTHVTRSSDNKKWRLSFKSKTLATEKINNFHGKKINHSEDESMVAVFMTADDAIKCAVEIYTEIKKKSNDPKEREWSTAFKVGISGNQPNIENDRFFEKAIQLAQRLSLIAGSHFIVVTSLVEKMSNFNEIVDSLSSVKVISPGEEKFLVSLFDNAEDKLTDENFNVESLSRDMGISRCQLYRKILSITDRSPNSFIRNLRMQKAFSLIKKKQHNISEVALEVGFNNPSYFSKCFQEKYGVIPSRVMC